MDIQTRTGLKVYPRTDEQKRRYKQNYYNKHPKYCKECQVVILDRVMGKVFCSLACYRTRRLRSARKSRAQLQLKFRQWKEAKGCVRCGYNKFGGALDLDHIDPKTKARRILAIDWKHRTKRPLIMAELAKCQLLCANCHREKTFQSEKA